MGKWEKFGIAYIAAAVALTRLPDEPRDMMDHFQVIACFAMWALFVGRMSYVLFKDRD